MRRTCGASATGAIDAVIGTNPSVEGTMLLLVALFLSSASTYPEAVDSILSSVGCRSRVRFMGLPRLSSVVCTVVSDAGLTVGLSRVR